MTDEEIIAALERIDQLGMDNPSAGSLALDGLYSRVDVHRVQALDIHRRRARQEQARRELTAPGGPGLPFGPGSNLSLERPDLNEATWQALLQGQVRQDVEAGTGRGSDRRRAVLYEIDLHDTPWWVVHHQQGPLTSSYTAYPAAGDAVAAYDSITATIPDAGR